MANLPDSKQRVGDRGPVLMSEDEVAAIGRLPGARPEARVLVTDPVGGALP
jgi:hypothetical protein